MGYSRQSVSQGRTETGWRVSYKELARRLHEHGIKETEDSITSKLGRGTFAVTFFLATLAVLEMEGIRLEDL